MAKIAPDNKKLKGKAAKIAASTAAKKKTATPATPTKPAEQQIVNYGKCCTCTHYCRPFCKLTNSYTARKQTCQSYNI